MRLAVFCKMKKRDGEQFPQVAIVEGKTKGLFGIQG